MVSALKNYTVVFGIISQFNSSCTKVGEKLNKVVEEVLFQMGEPCPDSEENWSKVNSWEEPGLCRDNIEKLFSFSILMARVFAPGDPAKHIMNSTKYCI
uniref:Putative interleukin-23 subunit p19b n=1 Tax=Oncorhynchus mykiss TaxID=8022 RepID=A0A0H4TDE0_ONCMY|nr:putative interleukin-23 subunit p19b [Oncorhynchus mykiss]